MFHPFSEWRMRSETKRSMSLALLLSLATDLYPEFSFFGMHGFDQTLAFIPLPSNL